MRYKAEYIWIDGTRPTAKLRSKTKILADRAEPPIWGFDGSSTNQAEGHASDRVLKPVASFPDPIRGGDDLLVICEVYNTDDTPHESNTRAALREVSEKHVSKESQGTRADGSRNAAINAANLVTAAVVIESMFDDPRVVSVAVTRGGFILKDGQ